MPDKFERFLFLKPMLLIGCCCVFLVKTQAQIELTLNPVAFYERSVHASYVVGLTKRLDMGLDMFGGVSDLQFLYVHSKYYPSPRTRQDRFFLGVFGGFARQEEDSDVVFGLFYGYKEASKEHLVFEVAAGAGKGISGIGNFFAPYFRFNLGYRFTPLK